MTNIEKIKEIFPNINIYEHGSTYSINNEYNFNASWCNAEYIEPTTKNNLAQERYQDLIEYFGGEDTVLKDRKEFKAWLERVKWHIKRADELGRAFGQLKPTTKDCLLVEQIVDEVVEKVMPIKPKDMPSVTQQLSSGLEKNSKKLEKDFGELDCISRKVVIDELKRYFHDEYYQRTSIQDCRDCFIEDVLNHLPSVTPQPRKGKWMKTPKAVMGEGYMWYCDKCNHEVYQDSSRSYPSENFCPNCGSDNREVEE